MYTFNEFQEEALTTTGPLEHLSQDELVFYLAMGMASEAGEVAGKIKKYLREGDEKYIKEALSEAGDVLWYNAVFVHAITAQDNAFERCAVEVINKLADRKARGVLTGSGDNR